MNQFEIDDLTRELVMTAEMCGTSLSDAGAALFSAELSTYDPVQVKRALRKCRLELKGRLTMASVIERLDDGRPGAEEAWSLMPFDESQTVVWTEEMALAFGIAGPLIGEGDKIGARMAFKEVYSRMVSEAREQRKPVSWTASLGHDKNGREAALMVAVDRGRLTRADAESLGLGYSGPVSQDMMALVYGGKQ